MKINKLSIYTICALGLLSASCSDMDLEPKGILSENTLLKSDAGIQKYLSVIYQDAPIEDFNYGQGDDYKGYVGSNNKNDYHPGNLWEAQKNSPASAAMEAVGRCTKYGDGWGYWPYDRIHDINNFLEKLDEYSSYYDDQTLLEYKAEGRFLRALYYFGLVKRYGGVPIVDKVLDPTSPLDELRQPRDTEDACWMFIHDDLQFAMENGSDVKTPGRANRYAAAALMSRAMLYAGSVAKYGGYISTSGPAVTAGLMGMPQARAKDYFQYSYDACKFLREAGFSLHTGSDKEKAFVEVFLNDCKDDEDIFVKQYTTRIDALWKTSLFHNWDVMTLPLGTGLSGAVGCALQPTWELMQLFEMPAVVDEDGKPVRFNSREELWNNGQMEARARATFFFPGMTEPLSGQVMDIQAGVYKSYPGTAADGTSETQGSINDYTDTYRVRGQQPLTYQDITFNGTTYPNVRVNGAFGLNEGTGDEGYTRTGAFIRKYVSNSDASGRTDLMYCKQSFKVFRFGEILCNWAEAAYELGDLTNSNNLKSEAFEYINELRERAGASRHEMLASPQDIGTALYGFKIDENLQFIRDERGRELCYENHRLFDLRRWRVADKLFLDGKYAHTLLPYYVLDEGKWIYLNEVEREGRRVTFERRWYYEQIPAGEIGKNPNLLRNDGY